MTPGQSVVPAEVLEVAKELQAAGFVHVTGLPMWNIHVKEAGHVIIQADARQLGRCDYNNGKTVVILPTGEVWLRAGIAPASYTRWCQNKGSAFVPCTNGEQIEMGLLLRRVADPYDNIHGKYPATPQIKG